MEAQHVCDVWSQHMRHALTIVTSDRHKCMIIIASNKCVHASDQKQPGNTLLCLEGGGGGQGGGRRGSARGAIVSQVYF